MGKRPFGLTVAAIKALKPQAAPFEIKDDAITGAYVEMRPSGAVSYVLRYRFNDKTCKLTLGKFDPDEGGLAKARAKAREARNAIGQGIDPAAAKRDAKAARAVAARQAEASLEPAPVAADLVETIAAEFIERHAKPNTRDWRETERLLQRNVVPHWRGRRLSQITKADIHAILDLMIDRGAAVGANRVFAQLRKMCGWAVSRGLIERNPCDGITRPSSETKRDRVLNDDELAQVWRGCEAISFPFGPLTQLLILTGQRRGEVAGMSYSELDLDGASWTIPAARVKNKRQHEVPLSPQAVALLRGTPRIVGSNFVFSTTGNTAPSGFSNSKEHLDRVLLTLAPQPLEPWTIHDLRRSVASGMARIGVALHVIEKVLNHVSGSFGGIVGVYQRHSYEAEMRAALDAWAEHMASIVRNQNHFPPISEK
jgi:integrase